MAINCTSRSRVQICHSLMLSQIVWENMLLIMVYKFTVHCIVYSKLLSLKSHCSISELLHFCSVDSLFFNQSESYYMFFTIESLFSTNQRAITLFHCCSANQWANTLFHCLHVQEVHVATLFRIYFTVVNGMDCDTVIWLINLPFNPLISKFFTGDRQTDWADRVRKYFAHAREG